MCSAISIPIYSLVFLLFWYFSSCCTTCWVGYVQCCFWHFHECVSFVLFSILSIGSHQLIWESLAYKILVFFLFILRDFYPHQIQFCLQHAEAKVPLIISISSKSIAGLKNGDDGYQIPDLLTLILKYDLAQTTKSEKFYIPELLMRWGKEAYLCILRNWHNYKKRAVLRRKETH